MTPKHLIVNQMDACNWLFNEFTKDFSDEDAKFQPFEGGNHLNWILVHLATTQDSIISVVGNTPKQISDTLHKNYGGSSQCKADDGMTKAEAWKLFTATHARAVEFVNNFDESKYAQPAPEGSPPMFKTTGEFLGLLGTHSFWHFGQLSVNRRMLKKPKVLGSPAA